MNQTWEKVKNLILGSILARLAQSPSPPPPPPPLLFFVDFTLASIMAFTSASS